jgi:catechol 2,3-dioxygenase-like lactoylglutathione lyase family enzyme
LSAAPSDVPANLVAEIAYAVSDVAAMRHYLLKCGLHPSSIESASAHNLQFSISYQEGHKITFVQQPKRYTIFEGPHQPTSQALIHVGLVVHDRAIEDAFYKDILGFHVYWHGGMKDDETNWVDMQVPDGSDWIEYMLNVSANADHHTLGVMNHIALGVPDIKAAREQLIKNGWTGTEQPKIGRDGKWQLNLYDPDDTRVEFMEFTPTQKPCCSEYTGPHPGQKP